jgi:cytochrome P450
VNGPESGTPFDDLIHRALASPEGRADPYPLYRELLAVPQLHRSAVDGMWYAFRYEPCRQLLQESRLGHDPARPARLPGVEEPTPGQRRLLERRGRRSASMLGTNPPDHTRLRGLVNRAFTPRRVQGLRGRITELVDERLAHLAEAGTGDVMAELAFPLPVRVISELLGVPAEGADLFRPVLVESLMERGRDLTDDEVERAEAVFEARDEFFRSLIAERRASPRDDMLSALVAVRDEEDGRLSEAELMATVLILYLAGFVTTTNLIGNGLLALLRHPGEMARLWADGGLVPSAVEEMLRHDSPVPFVTRDVLEPVRIGPDLLQPGDVVVTVLGAANRDPERFPDPDRFDVGRVDSHPLSFGAGIHFCLGAPLARLEAQAVFERMRERFARIELLEADPPLAPGFLRGRRRLPVRVESRPAGYRSPGVPEAVPASGPAQSAPCAAPPS